MKHFNFLLGLLVVLVLGAGSSFGQNVEVMDPLLKAQILKYEITLASAEVALKDFDTSQQQILEMINKGGPVSAENIKNHLTKTYVCERFKQSAMREELQALRLLNTYPNLEASAKTLELINRMMTIRNYRTQGIIINILQDPAPQPHLQLSTPVPMQRTS